MSEYIYEHKPSGSDHMGKPVELPTLVQREEIVRCRDCKEFAFGDIEYATVDWCDYWGAYVESPNGFCAWGKPRWEGDTE